MKLHIDQQADKLTNAKDTTNKMSQKYEQKEIEMLELQNYVESLKNEKIEMQQNMSGRTGNQRRHTEISN